MSNITVKRLGGFAGFLIIPLFFASIIYLLVFRRFDLPVNTALIILGLCIIAYVVTNPEEIARVLGARFFRSWVISLISVAALTGILVMINILVGRIPAQIDNTSNKAFTVSEQTVKALERVQEPVTVSIFFSSNTTASRDQALDLLKAYQSRSDKITVKSFDINAAIAEVQKYRINADPVVIFESPTRREDVTIVGEQEFTRALLKIVQKVDRRVFFTTGHGERSIIFSTQTNQEGFSEAVSALKNNNFTVSTINFLNNTDAAGKAITLNPATDIIIVGAPTAPFQDQEKQKLVGFLRQGGKAMFLNDPTNFLSTTSKSDVNAMLTEWGGLGFEDGIVVETNPQFYGAEDPRILLPNLLEGPISLSRNYPVVMPFAGGVKAGANSTGFTPILNTTNLSYLKTSAEQINANNFNFVQGSDKQGPINLAVAFEADAKETTPSNLAVPGGADVGKTRILLVNSITWATDVQRGFGLPQSPGNYNLFVNSINWLAQEKDAVVIAPKQPESRPFVINQSQNDFIFWTSIAALPILVFIIGVVVWWRRR
jgi:ABC-2 type transport system permease protein